MLTSTQQAFLTLAEEQGGEVWLKDLMRHAAQRIAAGVTMTAFGGGEGTGSGVVERPAAQVMADCQVCLNFLAGLPIRGEVLPDRRTRRRVVV